jgi:hypothetical protein
MQYFAERRVGAAGASSSAAAAVLCFIAFFICSTVTQSILNQDRALHMDVTEAYAWGREFRLSYAQHGPFWAWITGAWFEIVPRTNTMFVVLEALNATAGVIGVYMLLGLFASGRERTTAALLLLATPFYTFAAYRYNANTIFVSLWPWTLFFFVRAVERLSKVDSLLFGIFAAFCFLSKYYTVLLLVTCAAALFMHANARRFLRSPLPWIAGAAFAPLVIPHAMHALTQEVGPVAYAQGLTGLGWAPVLSKLWRFLWENALSLAALAGIVAVCRFIAAQKPVSRPDRFLTVLAWGPLLLTVVSALAFRLKLEPPMALGIFPLVTLYFMRAAGVSGSLVFRTAAVVAAGAMLLPMAAAPFVAARTAATSESPSYVMPYRELSAAITDLWRTRTTEPLRIVGGRRPIADGLAFYGPGDLSSFSGMDFRRAPWITPARLHDEGFVVVCVQGDEDCVSGAKAFLPADYYRPESIQLSRTLGGRNTPAATFDVFVVPPAGLTVGSLSK